MKHIFRHFKLYLLFIIFILAILGIVFHDKLIQYLQSPCNSTLENYLVELISTLVFSLTAALIVFYAGKKMNEIRFYLNVEKFLLTISSLRQNNLINPKVARLIVKSVTKNFGKSSIQNKIKERINDQLVSESDIQSESCKICGLLSDSIKNKCIHCKMDYFVWNLKEEEDELREIQELKRELTSNK